MEDVYPMDFSVYPLDLSITGDGAVEAVSINPAISSGTVMMSGEMVPPNPHIWQPANQFAGQLYYEAQTDVLQTAEPLPAYFNLETPLHQIGQSSYGGGAPVDQYWQPSQYTEANYIGNSEVPASGLEPFTAPSGNDFSISSLLPVPIDLQHNVDQVVQQGGTRTDMYPCHVCHKHFKDYSGWKSHRRVHERPFKCTYCPLRYANKSSRDLHIRTKHTGERPFICPNCGKQFANINCCKVHVRREVCTNLKNR